MFWKLFIYSKQIQETFGKDKMTIKTSNPLLQYNASVYKDCVDIRVYKRPLESGLSFKIVLPKLFFEQLNRRRTEFWKIFVPPHILVLLEFRS